MWNRITIAISVAMISAVPAALLGDDFSFGTTSPQFSATVFRGEPLKDISQGTIHVVEFGGTTCVPCIKFIPEMNKLQQQYPDVIFVSVFCESLDAVKQFMDGPGVIGRFKTSHSWALQNQQRCECSVSAFKLVFGTR